ncbi:hypothetical protein AOG1_31070 [Geobacter sp. AOG1]|nr:hypothetical protein AOG1_31070 [Geobacter sp. AOG1]
MATARCSAFATAMGMIDRVHRNTTNLGTFAKPAGTAGFTDGNIFVIQVTYLANGRHAFLENHSHLSRRKLDLSVLAFFGHELSESTRTAGQLRAFANLQLNVVNDRAERDCFERQRITRLDVSFGTCNHRIANLEVERRKNVAFLAININKQCNTGAPIRVILN